MKYRIFILITGLALALTSCFYSGPCVSGSGPLLSEEREVGEFRAVVNATSFEVIVSQADTFGVVVMAQGNLLPVIETFVSGSTLHVDTRSGACIRSSLGIQVLVSLPQLEELRGTGSGLLVADRLEAFYEGHISNHGSGSVFVDSVFGSRINMNNDGSGRTEALMVDASRIKLWQDGSGSLRAGKLLNNLELEIAHQSSGRLETTLYEGGSVIIGQGGSGPLELAGRADEVSINHTASGRLDAIDLQLREARVRNSGSGQVLVWVTEYLDAEIQGSGDIIYKGDPLVSLMDEGSGSLRRY